MFSKQLTVINACDAGREGELIFRYIMQAAKSKKKIGVKKNWKRSFITLWKPALYRPVYNVIYKLITTDKKTIYGLLYAS